MAVTKRIIYLSKPNPTKKYIQKILLKYKGTGVIIAVRITSKSNGKVFFNARTQQYSSDSDLSAVAFFSGAIRETNMTRLIYIQEAGECKKFTSVNFRGITTKDYPYKWPLNYCILNSSDLPLKNKTTFYFLMQ
jgi:hypothetical protein